MNSVLSYNSATPGRFVLTPSPCAQRVLPPFVGRFRFQSLLALSEPDTGSQQPAFQLVEINRLPRLEQHRIVDVIVAVMHGNQVMRRNATLLGRVIQIGDMLEMLAIMRKQRVVQAEHTLPLHLRSRQAIQKGLARSVQGLR